MVLVKPHKEKFHILKVFKRSGVQLELKSTSKIKHEPFIRSFIQQDQMTDNLIMSENQMYQVDFEHGTKDLIIRHFENVLDLNEKTGYIVQFYSPVINPTYRKSCFFIKNRKFQRHRQALILPYISDSFITFNKRDNYSQFNCFVEFKDPKSGKISTCILNYAPYFGKLIQTSISGQILKIINMKPYYHQFGSLTLSISPNAQLYA